MFFLASRGYRCIAHDRRGHGRSSQPWNSNDLDTGDDDQIVPIANSALLSSKLIKNATLKIYKGAPHGMSTTLKHEVNEELLAFIKG